MPQSLNATLMNLMSSNWDILYCKDAATIFGAVIPPA